MPRGNGERPTGTVRRVSGRTSNSLYFTRTMHRTPPGKKTRRSEPTGLAAASATIEEEGAVGLNTERLEQTPPSPPESQSAKPSIVTTESASVFRQPNETLINLLQNVNLDTSLPPPPINVAANVAHAAAAGIAPARFGNLMGVPSFRQAQGRSITRDWLLLSKLTVHLQESVP